MHEHVLGEQEVDDDQLHSDFWTREQTVLELGLAFEDEHIVLPNDLILQIETTFPNGHAMISLLLTDIKQVQVAHPFLLRRYIVVLQVVANQDCALFRPNVIPIK